MLDLKFEIKMLKRTRAQEKSQGKHQRSNEEKKEELFDRPMKF